MDKLFSELQGKLRSIEPKTVSVGGLSLRAASVLVPLLRRGNEPRMLFTKRTVNLRAHAGQISFPGGARDAADATSLHTALRETQEELGIPGPAIEILGLLDELPTITDFRVSPFVGILPPDVAYTPSPAEIELVIEVPIAHLMNPRHRRTERREINQVLRDIYFYEYGEHVIWGATARIVNNLLQLTGDLPSWKGLAR